MFFSCVAVIRPHSFASNKRQPADDTQLHTVISRLASFFGFCLERARMWLRCGGSFFHLHKKNRVRKPLGLKAPRVLVCTQRNPGNGAVVDPQKAVTSRSNVLNFDVKYVECLLIAIGFLRVLHTKAHGKLLRILFLSQWYASHAVNSNYEWKP